MFESWIPLTASLGNSAKLPTPTADVFAVRVRRPTEPPANGSVDYDRNSKELPAVAWRPPTLASRLMRNLILFRNSRRSGSVAARSQPAPLPASSEHPSPRVRVELPKAPPRRTTGSHNAPALDNSTTGTQQENSGTLFASGAPSLVPAEEPVTAKRTEETDHDLTCYPPLSAAIRCRHKVLQLGGGDDDHEASMVSIFAKADIDCTNYDPTKGQLRDLVDSYALGTLLRDAEAGEFLAAVATPDCSTFPFSLGPGGPRRYAAKVVVIATASRTTPQRI